MTARKVTYDSKGNDVTCMKEFDALKYHCKECTNKDCDEREEYDMRKMKLSDIKISESFANSIPSEKKLNECRNNWNQWNRQDRYIVVNHDNVLIDGYVMYLVLKENDIEEAVIKISNRCRKRWNRKNEKDWNVPHYRNELTTYIYGIHPNSKEKKEYVWRVPNSKKGLENDLLPGDKVLVSTKYGIKPVIVTKIEWLDELKSYREHIFSGDMTQAMLKERYCKAIDDLVKEFKRKTPMENCLIDELAEQIKAGVAND